MTANVATCHPERPMVARGLCGACYRLANGYTSGRGRSSRQLKRRREPAPDPDPPPVTRRDRLPSRYGADRCPKCGGGWRGHPGRPELSCWACGLEILPDEVR